jgi:hypothetical protein
VELLRLSPVFHTEHRVRTMQKQTLKRLGKELQAKMPLRDDLPNSIQNALERLAGADKSSTTSANDRVRDRVDEPTCQ